MAITVNEAYEVIDSVRALPKRYLFGIDKAIDRSVMALFTKVPYTGNRRKRLGQASVLLIDVPGVGKTDMIRILSFGIGADSALLAGHPEMMKSEIVGTEVWNTGLGKFFLRKGPIFNHIILFDEINRTHPKGQACFLQAMEERIAVMESTDQEKGILRNIEFPLYPVNKDADPTNHDQDLFFWVMATANPIEQAGTYPLPEAQLDRFTFSFRIGLPPREQEKKIRMKNVVSDKKRKMEKVVDIHEVLEVGDLITEVETPELASEYIMRLIENSRPHFKRRKFGNAELYQFIDNNVLIQEKPDKDALDQDKLFGEEPLGEGGGLSPRSNFSFEAGARTHAFFNKNEVVTVDNVKAMAHLVMDHRILLTPQAIGSGVTKHQVVQKIIEGTKVPPS